ncbi:MAG: transglycosylase SLT domain-containing protein [Prevotella sp.]|nr:transglycosylase SLT domain-containing protein [Prevotella sp.]MBQ6187444.1 transglycosylase SLT domain-containing protein [Prevotella sp.]
MKRMNTSPYVTRHVYSPMQDSEHGIISSYDAYFKQYAPIAGFDWRLLAAQCYQESAFDVRAVSWAGAQGLMQIMPSTASHLGMSSGDVWSAERNIEAATRYIKELSAQFRDIESSAERKKFVLASYNGGYNHIRDAMALTRKYGGNAKSWSDVRKYVLLLSDSKYYTDDVVKYGYMRGSETAGYVDSIISRWNSYKSKIAGGSVGSTDSSIPRPAKKPHRFKL